MFFGKIISNSQPFQFNEENVDENAGEVLMLTNVVLAPQSKVIFFLIFRTQLPFTSKRKAKNFLLSLSQKKDPKHLSIFSLHWLMISP